MSLKKLNEIVTKQRANHSEAREAIYTILLKSKDVLSVADMSALLTKNYAKKISQNTLYRHLNFFSDNNLVIVLQDQQKRAYYYINNEECPCFRVCSKCNLIKKLDKPIGLHEINKECDYVTIHHKCKMC